MSPVTPVRRACVAVLAITAQAGAQGFERRTFEIPMRDGVHLHTVALVPAAATDPLPIMMIRTPYSADRAFPNTDLPSSYVELAKDGYFFVVQDIRGRYRSEGQFVMNRAQHDPKDPRGVDESTDTYDTVDWLLKNLRGNNGRVGVMGVSYPGWLAGMAGVDAHPAVKAISPQAPMTDTWLGDDFFHQGAFRQTFGFEYAYSMEATNDGSKGVQIDRYDRYDWYLQFQTLKQLAAAGGANSLPSWQAFSTHPSYDAFWQAKAMQNHLRTPTMAILTVGGFWDQEDLFGPIKAYTTLEPNDTRGLNFFVEGPWFHGQWSRPGGDAIGNVKFGSNTADYYRENIQRPWFAYYLHDKGDGKFPEAWIFESGENAWHTFGSWPPPNAVPRTLYFQADGILSWSAPTAASGFDAYVADPAHPVPYTPRPVDGSRWRQWLTEDQRFVQNRPDVMSWETAPLTEDVTIAGNIVATLFASTTGSDADWVVKLIDVYPDSVAGDPRMGGYQLMVATDIMRGRYRNSYSRPEPIPPHKIVPFHVDLHQQLYRFKRGHRIMVQVQSTWFPLYDRNPQTYVPNIFNASPSDFRAQTHRIWRSAKYPSGVAVSVLPSN